ncbi:MAG: four helix bundle protein [Planctomycetota bacterium]|nr:MAG: four helix bundle protein [Planctomycetota bacterium]
MEAGRFRLDDFELYCLARAYRKRVYQLIKVLPLEEKYCLSTQMRRAALSVTNNIAEGHGRWHYQENIHYCRIARGSIDEVLDDLNVCLDEGYGDPQEVEQRKQEGYELIKRVNGYIAYLRKTRQGQDE